MPDESEKSRVPTVLWPGSVSEWPPRWEGTFEHGPGRPIVDTYSLQVRQELEAHAPFFEQLSDDQQAKLAHIVHTLDSLASAAAKELRNCRWTADELRTLEPPASAASERDVRRWRGDQANQLCVDACARARQAIMADDWITAVEAAMVAGNRALGDLANSAFRNQKPLLDQEQRAQRHNETARRDEAIRELAREIRARRPNLSTTAVAKQIEGTDVAEGLTVESLRKIITADRKAGNAGPA